MEFTFCNPILVSPRTWSSVGCSGVPRIGRRPATQRFRWSRTRAMRQEKDDNSSGEESPESLFMKELKRRGLAPPSSKYSRETKTRQEELGGSPVASSSTELKDDRDDQLKRTLALNSEGLDGLIPRAQELLKLGATFFLAFWPLILAILVLFVVVYLYFGPSFIHEGELHASKPPYVDPYQLLEEEEALSSVPVDSL